MQAYRVGRFDDGQAGDHAHKGNILERHMGSPVEGCADARVGSHQLHIQLCIVCREEELVKRPAGGKAAEGCCKGDLSPGTET
ncbi:hypothetical protein SDC9_187782 [bioreactor metagenome]|uniref:Uncharacterized protein n=1 Tax=bioreactor metagenome TaxID=1076179 RepID=A0A645HNU3_9ZZZZ